MSAIIKTQFRLHNASQFVEGLSEAVPSNFYAFLANPLDWLSDTSPPVPVESVEDDLSIRQGIMAIKKITSADVYRAIKHELWTAGRYYSGYRCDYGEAGVTARDKITGITYTPTSLHDTSFYVVDDNKVFVCLLPGSGSSTQAPSSFVGYNNGLAFQTPDGYWWKFITAPSTTLLSKKTTDFFPIDNTPSGTAISNSTLHRGGVYVVANSGGSSGWTSVNNAVANGTGPLGVRGDGTGFECDIVANVSGAITNIIVTNPGSGYTWLEFYSKAPMAGAGTVTGLKAMLTPSTGLGVNPINDLLATSVILSTTFDKRGGLAAEGKWPAYEEFRSIGIIKDLCSYGSYSNIYSSANENVQSCYVFKIDDASSINLDDILSSTASGNYLVTDVYLGAADSLPYDLVYCVKLKEKNTGTTYGNTVANNLPAPGVFTKPGNSYTVTQVINPDVNVFSGDILYIEHRRATPRSATQTETVIFAIEF